MHVCGEEVGGKFVRRWSRVAGSSHPSALCTVDVLPFCSLCSGFAPQVLGARSLLFAGPVADKGCRLLLRLFDYGCRGVYVGVCVWIEDRYCGAAPLGAPSVLGGTLVNCMSYHHDNHGCVDAGVWLVLDRQG